MSSFLCCPCLRIVDAAERGVVKTFGKFSRIAEPGLTYIHWPLQSICSVSTRVVNFEMKTDTKTRDNVTLTLQTSIQYSVEPKRVDDFHFKLTNPHQQIEAYVDNIVRGEIPKMDLDDVYSAKAELADTIRKVLADHLCEFGIIVRHCLMTDIAPNKSVLQAMNEINASKRMREANVQKAEAVKYSALKKAEGDAEAVLLNADAAAKAAIRAAEGEAIAAVKRAGGEAEAAIRLAQAGAEVHRLTGEGTANERLALAGGLKSALALLQGTSGMNGADAMHALLMSQHLDTLKQFANSGRSSIVVPHGPGSVSDMESQVNPLRPFLISIASQSRWCLSIIIISILTFHATCRPPQSVLRVRPCNALGGTSPHDGQRIVM
jgi:regulator of protease activity HflC (stomatin/prohibitin superfamily)